MVVHKSDRKKLPVGSILLSVKRKVVRQVVSKIIEHQYEVLKYRDVHGKIHEVYIPLEDDAEGSAVWNDIVPGTHITSDLLSYIAFNQYLMASPGYRESSNRLADMGWITCRQNLIDWMDKGAGQLKKLMPALKKIALRDGANVNVDETWARYQTHFGHKKAVYFLKRIGKLYAREDEYRRSGLSAEEIKAKRNDADSSRWSREMWTELYELLALPEASMSGLMRKAFNYLRTFWEQLFRYREDGEYAIDNLAA